MKKFLLVGLAVALAAVMFTGCADNGAGSDSGGGGSTIYEEYTPPTDAVQAVSQDALIALLDTNSGVSKIVYDGVAPTADLTIPSGKTLYYDVGSSGITLGKHLLVEGELHIYGGELTTATAGKVAMSGKVFVEAGGTLIATAAQDVTTITTNAPTPTNCNIASTNLTINQGGRLELPAAAIVADNSAPATGTFTAAEAWAAADSGNLSFAAAVTNGTLKMFAALTGSATRYLAATAGVASYGASNTTDTSVTIPENFQLTGHSGDTLEKVTSLTVGKGASLTASGATLAVATKIDLKDGAALTCGALNIASPAVTQIVTGINTTITMTGTIDKLAASSSIGAGSKVTIPTISNSNSTTLAVAAGATVNGVMFPVAATLKDTIASSVLTLAADYTIPVGKSLVVTKDSSNTVSISGAVLKKGTTDGTVTLDGPNAAVTLNFATDGASLVMADGGTIVCASTGTVLIGQTTNTTLGAGTFTFTGASASNTLTLAPTNATTGATITGTAATDKLSLDADATLSIAAGSTNGVVLDKVILDLSASTTGGGGVTITSGGKLTAPIAANGKIKIDGSTNDVTTTTSGGVTSAASDGGWQLASGVFTVKTSGNKTLDKSFVVATCNDDT